MKYYILLFALFSIGTSNKTHIDDTKLYSLSLTQIKDNHQFLQNSVNNEYKTKYQYKEVYVIIAPEKIPFQDRGQRKNKNQFFKYLQNDLRIGQITVVINNYADQVFKNIEKYIIRHGLDPVELPDQTIKLFPTGAINLTRGWLEDTSTIARYKDVVVTYKSTTKILLLLVPIKFHSLMFIYQYHTTTPILKASGETQGKLTNVKANLSLTFDFNKYVASLDKLDITDTGRINLNFSGNGILDWITSTMSDVVTFTLHPIIIRVIQSLIKKELDKTLLLINDLIKNILNINAFDHIPSSAL